MIGYDQLASEASDYGLESGSRRVMNEDLLL